LHLVRIDHHPALDGRQMLPFLAARAVPGVEEVVDGVYRRSLADDSVLSLRPSERHTEVDGPIAAARTILRLDADPDAILAHLGADPLLGALVRDAPGRRIPGHPDRAELAVRAVLGQQVSVAAARTLAGRLVASLGEPLRRPVGGITHHFPTPSALAALDPETLPMPRARGRALVRLATALADGEPVGEHLPGVGPWTAAYVALRSGDDDAFLPTDLGVRHGLSALGADPRRAAELAEAWRPYRGFAVAHLWAAAATPRRDPARGATA
jgi:AraC family transcriptional regulator, regulatory protein of adaptative response / DNA-3-methyladenine glycosylase II